jgi:hypothetical protein
MILNTPHTEQSGEVQIDWNFVQILQMEEEPLRHLASSELSTISLMYLSWLERFSDFKIYTLTCLFSQIMVRPRVGDFLYSREELAIMLEDIRIIKELGLGNRLRGFVLGVLNKEGRVDVECMKA